MAHVLTNGEISVTVYGDFAPEYIRTDRNGTKIYHDHNCPRCAGHGFSDKWHATGRVCFACGGTGKRPAPLVIKVYTAEHAAKLEARRAAKAAANAPTEEELMQRADEARRNAWQNNGFDRDGVGYLYTGNTYKVRAKISSRGGRWCSYFRGWIAPVDIGPLDGVTIKRLNAADLCNGYGNLDPEKCWDACN